MFGKKINWSLRHQSLQWWIGIFGAIFTPILTYFGYSGTDITSWEILGKMLLDFVSNPALIIIVLGSVITFCSVSADPTTKGLGDSARALDYTKQG